jgi:exopolysaccharide/PEP-CTERM locus tyrosine autokinase
VSIIEKTVQIAEEGKVERKGQKLRVQSRNKPHANNSHPHIDWQTDFTNQLLGESATDPLFINQFKHLKRAIIQSAFGPLAESDSNIVIITSALPNAGKTFISMNLAQSMAQERDRKVLLVDTDNIKSTLTTTLGLNDKDGFFDVLDKPDLRLEDVILPTMMPNLEFLPTGARYTDSTELVDSRRAKNLLERIASEDSDRLIIFDAPPLLATSDAPALAGLAGQFLLVVEAGSTTQSDLAAALEFFDDDKKVGLILNKSPRIANSLYGSYYSPYRPGEDG